MAQVDPEVTARENYAVVTVVQALLGMVGDGLDGVAVAASRSTVDVYFALTRDTPGLRDDVAEVVGEVEGLYLPDEPTVRAHVTVGPPDQGWEGRSHRLVFVRKR